MKKKQLVKAALSHPELFTTADLSFFKLWLRERKKKKLQKKTAKIKQNQGENN